MPLNVSNDAQTLLFKKLFGEAHPVTIAVQSLIGAGAKIEVSLYVVKVSYQGKVSTQALTVGTTALIKGSVPEITVNQNKFMLKTFVENLVGAGLGPDDIKAQMKFISPEPDKVAPAPAAAPEVQKPTNPPPAKPQSFAGAGSSTVSHDTKVIALKDATMLGQRVKGTSIGSVYRVVALNDSVKIASQIKGKDISLRVECVNPSSAEMAAIEAAFDWKSTYGSKHMSAGSLSTSKVIGAFLFSLDVQFLKMAHGAVELEMANA